MTERLTERLLALKWVYIVCGPVRLFRLMQPDSRRSVLRRRPYGSVLLSPKRRRRRSPVRKILVRGHHNLLRGVSLWDADNAETKISFFDIELTEQDPETLTARFGRP